MRLFRSILLCIAALSSTVQAHESRPLYVEIHQQTDTNFLLQWKTPSSVPARNNPVIYLEGCVAKARPVVVQASEGLLNKQQLHCPINLSRVLITYPRSNQAIATLIRFHRINGEVHTKLLGSSDYEWLVPDQESTLGVAVDYTKMGAAHIWNGIDHLLFLACLIFIAGTVKRIVITVTGFTLAHSLTLVLSTLHIVNLPVAPVEAVIALSIVLLAKEIAVGRHNTLTWRYPMAVSSSFGLLHGFGFASALNEIGLPQTELFTGLLFFNLGVEVGQVLFVFLAVALYRLLIYSKFNIQKPVIAKPASYVIGIVASFWVIERSAGFL
ncbi:MAG: hypothetical protein COC20_01765 [Cellvibrionales bacterium]|nr:MAG: hypothetical protein COC20_01765 [Cellvibrionales bacterium]